MTNASFTKKYDPISKASFGLWLNKIHVQRKKIEQQWLGSVRAILEDLMKKERKRVKNSKQKLLRGKSKLQSKAKAEETPVGVVAFL